MTGSGERRAGTAAAGVEAPPPARRPPPFYERDGVVLYHGDCRDVLPALGPGSVDLVLTDPPYGATARPWDTPPDLPAFWRACARLLAPAGSVALTASQPFTAAAVTSNLGWFRHEWIWRKSRAANFGGARYQPMKKHESVLVFAPRRYKYRPVFVPGSAYRSRTQRPRADTRYGTFGRAAYQPNETRAARYPGSVIDVPSLRQQDSRQPTQKPLGLMEYLVRTYTDPLDLVVDPYAGSGTTLLAARRLGRRAVGVEAEERYCEAAARRLDED